MTAQPWFERAAESLRRTLQSGVGGEPPEAWVQGESFLVRFLVQESLESGSYDDEAYLEAESERLARESVEAFQAYLGAEHESWLAIREPNTWVLTESLRPIDVEEKSARENEVCTALSTGVRVLGSAEVVVQLHSITENELATLGRSGAAERFFGFVAALGLNATVACYLAIKGLPDGADPTGLNTVLAVGIAVCVLGTIAWLTFLVGSRGIAKVVRARRAD